MSEVLTMMILIGWATWGFFKGLGLGRYGDTREYAIWSTCGIVWAFVASIIDIFYNSTHGGYKALTRASDVELVLSVLLAIVIFVSIIGTSFMIGHAIGRALRERDEKLLRTKRSGFGLLQCKDCGLKYLWRGYPHFIGCPRCRGLNYESITNDEFLSK